MRRIAGTAAASSAADLDKRMGRRQTVRMNDTVKSPNDCNTMIDVRKGVDATDHELGDLLKRRFEYMRAAARIKPLRTQVRDEARKRAVIDAARQQAIENDLPAPPIAKIWDLLVEASIAYELAEWEALHSDRDAPSAPTPADVRS